MEDARRRWWTKLSEYVNPNCAWPGTCDQVIVISQTAGDHNPMSFRSLIAVGAVFSLLAACTTGPQARRFVVPVDEPTSYGLFLAGTYATAIGESNAALSYYDAALSREGDNLVVVHRAFMSAIASGDMDRAASLAEELLASPYQDPLARLVLAGRAIKRGRYGRAVDLLEGGDLGPFNRVVGSMMLAWAYEGKGEVDAALVSLKAPHDAPLLAHITQLHAALILERAGASRGADIAFERALSSGVLRWTAIEAYGRFLERDGRTSEAAILYRANLLERPNDDASLAGLARIASGENALAFVDDPASGASLAVFAPTAAVAPRANADLAILYLRLALDIDPANGPARYLLGQVLSQAGFSDQALDVLIIDPDSPAYSSQLDIQAAWLLLDAGRTQEALSVARRAVDNERGIQARLSLADMYAALDQHDQAIAIQNSILQSAANDGGVGREHWIVYFARAASREAIGDWEGAQSDLQTALDLAPDHPSVMNGLGEVWLDRDENLPEAFALIKRAVDIAPDAPQFVAALGRAHFKLGEYDDAVSQLERAAALEPDDPVINDYLGDAYWRVGRRLESGFQWNRALDLDPSPSHRSDLQRKIQFGLANATDGSSE